MAAGDGAAAMDPAFLAAAAAELYAVGALYDPGSHEALPDFQGFPDLDPRFWPPGPQ